jgi:hypothetical protein
MCGDSELKRDGRGSTGRSNRQQDASDQHLKAEGAARIVEACHARCRRRVSSCTDNARRARGAVLGGPEMAQEVVMFELVGEQEEGVERHAEERSAISPPASH